MAEGYTPSRKAMAVGALQWAVVGYAVASAVNSTVVDYYWFVRDAFAAEIPGPLDVLVTAAFPVLVLGGLAAGYLRVRYRTDSAESERRDHRRRVAFLFVLLALGVVALVVEMAVSELLGDRLYTVPYFLASPVLDLSVVVGAYGLVYRAGVDWTRAGDRTTDGASRPSRVAGVVGGVQWALTAFHLGLIAFVAVSEYLVRTRESFGFDLGAEFVVALTVVILAGYRWARRPADSAAVESAHTRRVEYVFSVVAFDVVLSILSGLVVVAFPALALEFNFILFGGVLALSLVFAFLSTYVADFGLLGRLLST